jgi:tripartite-type tricarboxylate transporter receptor subunit TctC
VPLWFSIWVHVEAPRPILEALHAEVTEFSKAPDVPSRLLLCGSLPVSSTQAELMAFPNAATKSTSELIEAANIKLE